jgi:pimeloyl-ACP methyl ester carboxylesterase
MKHTRIKHALSFLLVITALFVGTPSAYAATGRQLTDDAIAALKSSATTTTVKNLTMLTWSWLEVNYGYQDPNYPDAASYPLTVDFVGSNFSNVQKIVYLLPGGGMNFRSSFFTPIDSNLAHYFRNNGYLVIGITPRENNVPSGLSPSSYAFMADWGLEQHKDDIQKVIGIIQGKINQRYPTLKYRVLGHSFGAAYALDYASDCSGSLLEKLEKVIALDIYSFNPDPADPYFNQSARSYDDINNMLLDGGPYVDSTYSSFMSLMFISMLFPKIDSGTPRPSPNLGDFTFESLLYYSMINSKSTAIPGNELIDITDWPLVQSYVSGDYLFSPCPLFDSYHFNHSNLSTLREASFNLGSGLVPYAVYRDYFAGNAYNTEDTYKINWSEITKPVLWVNTELGYGGHPPFYRIPYGATKITQCTPQFIPGYGHLDVLSSRTAQQDVWYLFTK